MTSLLIVRDGEANNLTRFGRQLQEAATKLLPDFIDQFGFGFQDGGCAIFAYALHIWSGERLGLYGLRSRAAGIERDMIYKMGELERLPNCIIKSTTRQEIEIRSIPWSRPTSRRLARSLQGLLPDPLELPWLAAHTQAVEDTLAIIRKNCTAQ